MTSGFGGRRKKKNWILNRSRGKRSKSRAALCAGSCAGSRGIEALESRVMLASTPFYGHVLQLPGLWQAEAFDNGGEGVAYHDTTAVNEGGAFRNTGVDIEPTLDVGGGYNVGWTHAGEWL